MSNLTKTLQEIKDRAEKNLAEAKQLIQPEQSWIEDNTDLLRLVKALEKAIEQRDDANYLYIERINDSGLTELTLEENQELKYILEGK